MFPKIYIKMQIAQISEDNLEEEHSWRIDYLVPTLIVKL